MDYGDSPFEWTASRTNVPDNSNANRADVPDDSASGLRF
jgi:hypothetical protein